MHTLSARKLLAEAPRLKGGGIALCPDHQFAAIEKGLAAVLATQVRVLATSQTNDKCCPFCGCSSEPYRLSNPRYAYCCRDCKRRWGRKTSPQNRLSCEKRAKLDSAILVGFNDAQVARIAGVAYRTAKRARLKSMPTLGNGTGCKICGSECTGALIPFLRERRAAHARFFKEEPPRFEDGGIALCDQHQREVYRKGLLKVAEAYLRGLALSPDNDKCPYCGTDAAPYSLVRDQRYTWMCRDCEYKWGKKVSP